MTGIKEDGSIYISEWFDDGFNIVDRPANAYKQVIIYINDADDDYRMDILFKPTEITIPILSETYPNALMLSADLRDNIGLGPAITLLESNGIPRTNPLWDLNHSDLWE